MDVDSTLVVAERTCDDPTVQRPLNRWSRLLLPLARRFDRRPLRAYPGRRQTSWSMGWFPTRMAAEVRRRAPDLVHLHWIGDGFVALADLPRFGKPLIWTLHDMWAFTGGCHYDEECGRYASGCGRCPILASRRENDVSRRTLAAKRKAWKNLRLTIVTPSRWLAGCARASALFRESDIRVIANGIDLDVYRPLPRAVAREILHLPPEGRLIAFGAVNSTSESRKGYAHLEKALRLLARDGAARETALCVFGASAPPDGERPALPARYLGRLQDDISLALLYAAADVFVAPSLQDNLPNTIVEALACGTPCVAFGIGGMGDLIDHGENGCLAKPFDTEDLARAIAWVLADEGRRTVLSEKARQKAEHNYDARKQAAAYTALYEEVLRGR